MKLLHRRLKSTKKLPDDKAAGAQDGRGLPAMRGGNSGPGTGDAAPQRSAEPYEQSPSQHRRSETAGENRVLHHQYQSSWSNDVVEEMNVRVNISRPEYPRHSPSASPSPPVKGSSPTWTAGYGGPASPRMVPMRSETSSASTGEAIISRSQALSPSSPPPDTAVAALPRPSMDGSQLSLRRKRSGWHSLSNILHRRDTTAPSADTALPSKPLSPVFHHKEPQTKLATRVSLDVAVPPYSPSTRSPFTPLPTIASSGAQSPRHHRGLSRFEARAQADRASFSQNPSFSLTPPRSVPHMSSLSEETPSHEREKVDGLASNGPGSGHVDMYHPVVLIPQLNLNSPGSELEQHSAGPEDTLDDSELSIRERRQRRLQRLGSDSGLTACEEDNEQPEEGAPLPTVKSHSPPSPEDYVSVSEARLQECREKLAATMPRLRPLQRAMTAPSSVPLTVSSPSQHTRTTGSDSSNEEIPHSMRHDQRDGSLTKTAGSATNSYEDMQIPGSPSPHPLPDVEHREVHPNTTFEVQTPGRLSTQRSASSPTVVTDLPLREFSRSRHDMDQNEVHVHVARKLSVDLMSPQLRPRLLDLSPANKKSTAVRVQYVERGRMGEEE